MRGPKPLTAIAVAGASGLGYYLYRSGGSVKGAEKEYSDDVHKAISNVKTHLPGSSPTSGQQPTHAEKDLKHLGARAGANIDKAGAKLDAAVADADRKAADARSAAEAYARDARASTMQAVDKADRKIEEGAAKAKGWFGGFWGGSSSK